jgi:hypothetical protein
MIISELERKRILSLHKLIKEEKDNTCSIERVTKDNFWEKVDECNIDLGNPHLSWKGIAYEYLKKFWEFTGTSDKEIKDIFERSRQSYIDYYSQPEIYEKIFQKMDYKNPERKSKKAKKIIDILINNIKEMKMIIDWDWQRPPYDAAIAVFHEKYGDLSIYMTNLFRTLTPKYNLEDTIKHEIGHLISQIAEMYYLEDNSEISNIIPQNFDSSRFEEYITSPSEVAANYRALRTLFNISPTDNFEQVYNKVKSSFENGDLIPLSGYTIDFESPYIVFTKPDEYSWDDMKTKLRFYDKNGRHVTSSEILTRIMDKEGNEGKLDISKLVELNKLLVKNGGSSQENIA